jgi:uridine phosphorylase
MTKTLYLKCLPKDVGSLVLLSGDPARVDRIALQLERARQIVRNREFAVATGRYRGQTISAVSAGIGAPSTAIALEELATLGIHTVVRVGTMMGLSAPLGTIIVPTGAARFEGTSRRYLPLEYPALPDWSLTHTLANAATDAGLPVRLGPTATFDAFYLDMAPSLVQHAAIGTALDLSTAQRAGILSFDMETSLIFTAGAALGLTTATICLVTVMAADPATFLDTEARASLEDRVVAAALDGLVAHVQTQ